jgi:hypothetical protein
MISLPEPHELDERDGYSAETLTDLPEPVNHLREEAVKRMDEFWKRAFRLVFGYKGDKLLALFALAHAIGEAQMTGCESATEVAVHLFADKKKKAAVTKAIKLFQDTLGIEPMGGQRTEQARKHMRAARAQQLKQ